MAEVKQKIRVQFDFTEHAYEEIEELQEALGASSKAETVRYALRTLQWLVEVSEQRKRVLTDDGETLNEVVFPFLPRKTLKRKVASRDIEVATV